MYGDQRGRGGDVRMTPGTSPQTSLAWMDERQHQEKLELAARIMEANEAAAIAAAQPPAPDPYVLADAFNGMATAFQNQDAQELAEAEERIAQLEAQIGSGS